MARAVRLFAILGNGAYIQRPKTALTEEWLAVVEQHLDAKYTALERHPSPKDRCCLPGLGDPKGYPFRWAELHAEAFHSLQLKYIRHVSGGLPSRSTPVPPISLGSLSPLRYLSVRNTRRLKGCMSGASAPQPTQPNRSRT